ncbi:MAG: alpha/beta hydrolase [Rhizomicrobium sp.]
MAGPLVRRAAAAQPTPKGRNIVLVHGLFADGSCWSDAIARLQPNGLSVTSVAAWRSRPSFYAVSTEDRTINPDLQRFMAKRMGATMIEAKASHVSLTSQPDIIANLIVEAAGQA